MQICSGAGVFGLHAAVRPQPLLCGSLKAEPAKPQSTGAVMRFLFSSQSCTLSFRPTGAGAEGPYVVQLMMEDFPRQNVTLTHTDGSREVKTSKHAISKVPVQFVLWGEASSRVALMEAVLSSHVDLLGGGRPVRVLQVLGSSRSVEKHRGVLSLGSYRQTPQGTS